MAELACQLATLFVLTSMREGKLSDDWDWEEAAVSPIYKKVSIDVVLLDFSSPKIANKIRELRCERKVPRMN